MQFGKTVWLQYVKKWKWCSFHTGNFHEIVGEMHEKSEPTFIVSCLVYSGKFEKTVFSYAHHKNHHKKRDKKKCWSNFLRTFSEILHEMTMQLSSKCIMHFKLDVWKHQRSLLRSLSWYFRNVSQLVLIEAANFLSHFISWKFVSTSQQEF